MLDKERIKEIVNFLNQHEDLLANNDLDKLYKCFPYKSTRKVAYLTEFLWNELKLGNNMLKHMTIIPNSCFSSPDHNTWVYEVIIPENIKRIDEFAFDGSKIESVIFKTPKCSFGFGAFIGCQKLQKVILSNGLTETSTCMFQTCISLSSINIPESVIVIGDSTFSGCEKLKNIYLPDSVIRIGREAFYGCSNITIKTPKRDKNNNIMFDSEVDRTFFNKHVVYV